MVRVQVSHASDRDYCIGIAEAVLGVGRELGEYLDSDNCFVGQTEGGFIAVMVNCDTADLLDIAVAEDHRNKGVATALMSFMDTECVSRGVKEIFLEVRKSNAPAISLYKKCGFEQISVRRKYYGNPTEDAVIMRKTL